MAKEGRIKLRGKSVEELIREVRNEEQKLQELRFDLARGKVKNSSLVRNARKNIAQLKTLIKESEKDSEVKNGGE